MHVPIMVGSQAADDMAAGGYHYNLSGSTSAPPAGPMTGHYSDDSPCPRCSHHRSQTCLVWLVLIIVLVTRDVVANWIGPWAGIWWVLLVPLVPHTIGTL